ncbi:MAG: cyclic nucleotide-binding domain-containing protein [Candidatus Marinimicrobia bacterium]|nr:cyclic nucleotide-binding domain-containing protein [Candidatus Neomarinimicrobiota bacterium]
MSNFIGDRVQRFYKNGDVIFKENDYGNSMYIIQSGEVEVSTVKNNQKVVLAKLPKGSIFGEMALIEQPYRSATVTALSDVSCIEINKVLFNQNMQSIPTWMQSFFQILVERLRESNKRQDTYTSYEKAKQIVILLSEYFRNYQALPDNNKSLLWQETIDKLGVMLNIPPIFVEKVLNRLILLKLLRREVDFEKGRRITINDEIHFFQFADYCIQKLYERAGVEGAQTYKSGSQEEIVTLNFIGKLISEQVGATDFPLDYLEAKCLEHLGYPLSKLEPTLKILIKKGILSKRIDEGIVIYDVNKSKYRDVINRDYINKKFMEYEVTIGKE